MAFERRQPSVDLRAFLDPLKPGEYFDCGRARLYGIDEALEAEAQRRGRAVGDDEFQLVATDGGLIFCRASIMFAIAARWKDLTIGRPQDGTRSGEAILPINWPTHGDLQFTVSRRLGSNVFRRWLQLQAQATRRSQVEQDARYERARPPGAPPANGHANSEANGHSSNGPSDEPSAGRTGLGARADALSEPAEPIDLGGVDELVGDGMRAGTQSDEQDHPDPVALGGANDSMSTGSAPATGDSDREAIHDATRQEQRRLDRAHGDLPPERADHRPEQTLDPLATIDAAIVDEWVDDRVPLASTRSAAPELPTAGPDEGETTSDPFQHADDGSGDNGHRHRAPHANDTAAHPRRFWTADDEVGGEAARFDTPAAARHPGPWPVVADDDATATQFMSRTVDGTDIFLGGEGEGDATSSGRSAGDDDRVGGDSGPRMRSGPMSVPVPEIHGARLHAAESNEPADGPRLDIRSTLLAGRRDSPWVEVLRERQVLILSVVTVVALGLLALIGFLTGDGGGNTETAADVPATAEVGADTGAVPPAGEAAVAAPATSATIAVEPPIGAAGGAPVDSTVPTLRVSSTSVQICHSNYGGCVPVAADVDCEGDGDGPAFQAGPVAVFGDDVYDLDTDDDREACEADQPRGESAITDG